MFEIPKLGDEDNSYDGSRIFTWLADICGLSVDLVSITHCEYVYSLLCIYSKSFSLRRAYIDANFKCVSSACQKSYLHAYKLREIILSEFYDSEIFLIRIQYMHINFAISKPKKWNSNRKTFILLTAEQNTDIK